MFKLPKRRILRTGKEFQQVYRLGHSYANRYLVLYVYPAGSPAGKAGFAAGKKLGTAVVRTRMKRLLRESFRLNQHKIRPGLSLILVGRKAAIGQKCGVIEKAFLNLGRKAGIFLDEKNGSGKERK